jgi:divalent metal cation (Fe/Co/Zn/Cd) transporter
MVDKSCDEETINKIISIVNKSNDVINIDDLKTRIFGNKIYIDMEIAVDKNLTILKAHEIAHFIHDKIEEEITEVKHCMIHVNPYNEKD